MTRPRSITTWLRLALIAPALCALAAGCSSSGGGGASHQPSLRAAVSSTTAPAPGSTAPAAATGATTTPPAGALTGTWTGRYSGSYSGTFRLTWRQSGTALTGTIEISGFGNAPTAISGSVHAAQISFGTVGENAVAYSGTVSGAAMSGTWHLQSSGAVGGSWSATRGS